MMTRSEVAERAGVGPETVRYYERRGLLPDPPRSAAGYRLYDESQVERLRFIGRAQKLGFTLAEISELLALRAAPETGRTDVRRCAQEKLSDVEARLRDLRRIRDALKRLVDACDEGRNAGSCPILDAMEQEDALPSPLG